MWMAKKSELRNYVQKTNGRRQRNTEDTLARKQDEINSIMQRSNRTAN